MDPNILFDKYLIRIQPLVRGFQSCFLSNQKQRRFATQRIGSGFYFFFIDREEKGVKKWHIYVRKKYSTYLEGNFLLPVGDQVEEGPGQPVLFGGELTLAEDTPAPMHF